MTDFKTYYEVSFSYGCGEYHASGSEYFKEYVNALKKAKERGENKDCRGNNLYWDICIKKVEAIPDKKLIKD